MREIPNQQAPGSDRGSSKSGATTGIGATGPAADPYRGRWAAERSAQGGATGMSSGYPATGATFGFGRDEERVPD